MILGFFLISSSFFTVLINTEFLESELYEPAKETPESSSEKFSGVSSIIFPEVTPNPRFLRD